MKNIIRITLAVWVVLWILFEVRPLFKERRLAQYRSLTGKPLEARRAIVYGEGLCEFLDYAKSKLPPGATFDLAGPPDGSVDIVRAYYYLYPYLKTSIPDFILVYNLPGFKKAGYGIFASLDDKSFILKADR